MKLMKNLAALMERSGENPYSLARKVKARYGRSPSQPTLLRILDGTSREPRRSSLQPVADFYGVSVDALFDEDLTQAERAGQLSPRPASRPLVEIDVLAVAGSMGFGESIPDHETVINRLNVEMEWVRKNLPAVSNPGNLKVISGYGDSMAPTYNDGDILLVDTGIRTVNIDGVYVLSANQRLYVKRVRQRMDGHFEISSDNPTVKTVDVLNGDHEVTVHGRVVWAWNGRKL